MLTNAVFANIWPFLGLLSRIFACIPVCSQAFLLLSLRFLRLRIFLRRFYFRTILLLNEEKNSIYIFAVKNAYNQNAKPAFTGCDHWNQVYE